MTLLIRGKDLLTRIIDPTAASVVKDGAIAVEADRITEVGRFSDLRQRHPQAEVLGSDQDVVVPGFVNSHHHVGLTPFQLGSPDLPLEVWSIRRHAARNTDPYLDTLYSAMEMVQSGITTVHHLHGRGLSGDLAESRRIVHEVLRAYSDIGMRVTYSLSLRDQNRFVQESDEAFIAKLPPELRERVRTFADHANMPIESQFELAAELQEEHAAGRLTRCQLAPANLHWCSDSTFERARSLARKYSTRLHIHVLETTRQREYAWREYGSSAIAHLDSLGLLGPDTTVAHAVWIDEGDIDLLASSGTLVCHNASSNLRLRSGVSPVLRLISRSVPVAIGIDEAGINDDRDMFAELRLVHDLHPAVEAPSGIAASLTAFDCFRMATEVGALSAGWGAEAGVLEPGRVADVTVIDWQRISEPYLDREVSLVDAILRRGRPSAVKAVVVAGKPILRDFEFTGIERGQVLEAIRGSLAREESPEERERRRLSQDLLPMVESFYRTYGRGH